MSVSVKYKVSQALLSDDKLYRYSLLRIWGNGGARKRVVFVMLNPSTANAEKDDATIRRCVGFAKSWGFDALEAVNLFAFRATNQKDMLAAVDPVGPENDEYIGNAVCGVGQVICAWGVEWQSRIINRANYVHTDLLPETYVLGLTRDGSPKHPVRLSSQLKPQLWHRQKNA